MVLAFDKPLADIEDFLASLDSENSLVGVTVSADHIPDIFDTALSEEDERNFKVEGVRA